MGLLNLQLPNSEYRVGRMKSSELVTLGEHGEPDFGVVSL